MPGSGSSESSAGTIATLWDNDSQDLDVFEEPEEDVVPGTQEIWASNTELRRGVSVPDKPKILTALFRRVTSAFQVVPSVTSVSSVPSAKSASTSALGENHNSNGPKPK